MNGSNQKLMFLAVRKFLQDQICTIDKFAEVSGLSQATVKNLKNKQHHRPNFRTLRDACDAMEREWEVQAHEIYNDVAALQKSDMGDTLSLFEKVKGVYVVYRFMRSHINNMSISCLEVTDFNSEEGRINVEFYGSHYYHSGTLEATRGEQALCMSFSGHEKNLAKKTCISYMMVSREDVQHKIADFLYGSLIMADPVGEVYHCPVFLERKQSPEDVVGVIDYVSENEVDRRIVNFLRQNALPNLENYGATAEVTSGGADNYGLNVQCFTRGKRLVQSLRQQPIKNTFAISPGNYSKKEELIAEGTLPQRKSRLGK